MDNLNMIDEDRTLQLFGYTSDELTPNSTKLIVRVCEGCGRYKILPKQGYHDLCPSCVQIQRHIDNPELGEEHSRRLIKLNKPDKKTLYKLYIEKEISPVEISKIYMVGKTTIRRWLLKYHIPIRSYKEAHNTKKYYKKASKIQKKRFENPKAYEKTRLATIKRFEDILEHEKQSEILRKRYEDPIAHERSSAAQQGQDYDNGEWTGFTNKGRPHLVSINQCIHLNSKFKGCEQHHIMTGVIINIPVDLHKQIWHRFPRDNREGKNMKEINKLAFKYLLGRL